jgi:hypothetical protein
MLGAVLVHDNLSTNTQATHEMGLSQPAFGINCLGNNCVLFAYRLYRGCTQETIIFAPNSISGFYITPVNLPFVLYSVD